MTFYIDLTIYEFEESYFELSYDFKENTDIILERYTRVVE